jgi:hypothetical protein
MSAISITDIKAQKKLFHNEWINVYPTTLPLDKIHFWKANNRTIFTFERLCRLEGKELDELSIEEITRFVAEQDAHKLQMLADSIGRNGVQVPLIIRDDGKLLDGNRRYFACEWLKMQHVDCGMKLPEFLSKIPVLVIRKADLKDTLELKILAEANFIPDLKIPWPLDAQARAVEEYYRRFQASKSADHETALIEVVNVFGIKRQRAMDLMDSLELTKRFISEGGQKDEQMRRRAIVEEKYVYFWEFLNKAMKGRRAYTDPSELAEVRDIFFYLMAKGVDNPITNVKQVEPLAQARRDPTAWSILKESKGGKLTVVVSIMNEKKDVRMAEDKIRVFLAWLKDAKALSGRCPMGWRFGSAGPREERSRL